MRRWCLGEDAGTGSDSDSHPGGFGASPRGACRGRCGESDFGVPPTERLREGLHLPHVGPDRVSARQRPVQAGGPGAHTHAQRGPGKRPAPRAQEEWGTSGRSGVVSE